MVRKYLLIIGCVLGLFTSKTYSQATTTLSIDSLNVLNTAVIGGFADVEVRVRVMDGFVSDTLFGDIYYYYLTDSMISLGDTAQIIELDSVNELVGDPFLDTIHIPLNPNEMKTGPLNLIVVWPAMMNPAVADSDSVVFYLQVGYMGIDPAFPERDENILYPLPAMQYLYIKPDELDIISELTISNMHGQIISTHTKNDILNGWINIDGLNSGFYMVTLRYKDGSFINKKILKE